jgi:hypothetical protein
MVLAKEPLELKLVVQKLQSASITNERFGLKFVRARLFVSNTTVTTDRILVTEEAVKCLNPPAT